MKEELNDFAQGYSRKFKKASYSKQILVLTLVPDKRSRMYYSEYSKYFEYHVWTSHVILW